MPTRFSLARVAVCFTSILLATIGLISSSASAQAQSTQVIYDDQLENGWQNLSSAAVNFSNTNPVHSGNFSAAVSTSPSNPAGFQAIWFHPAADMSTSGYLGITFWIYVPSPNFTPLEVQSISGNQTVNGSVVIPAPAPNTWTKETMSLSDLGCSDISNFAGFWIVTTSGHAEPAYYVDDVTLDGSSTPVPVTVSPSQVIGSVPSTALGVNALVTDSNLADGNVPKMLTAAGIGTVRYPGGSISDTYHWSTNTFADGFGNSGNYNSNNADFDQFMNAVTVPLHSTTIVTANYGSDSSGSADGDGEAVAWVAHAKAMGYGVKYWEIGNEIFGNGYYGDPGWETDFHAPYDGNRQGQAALSPTTYATNVLNYEADMKAVDPTIKVGAVLQIPGASPGVGSDGLQDWNSTVLQVCGSKIDFVILHWYPQGYGEADAPLLSSTSQIASFVQQVQALISQYCGSNAPNVQILVTETNSSFDEPQILSTVNTLFIADELQTWLESGVQNVDIWNLHNGPTVGLDSPDPTIFGTSLYGDFGILSDGMQVFDSSSNLVATEPPLDTPFASYYGIEMLNDLQGTGGKMVSAVSPQPLLATHAVTHPDGSVVVLLINKDPEDTLNAAVNVSSLNPAGSITVHTYGPLSTSISTSSIPAASNFIVAVPPYSLTEVNIPAAQTAFAITSASMSPATLAFAGGMITITANVVEPNQSATVTGVNVSLFKNGASYGGFKLTSAGGGVYSGSFGASQNLTGSSITYTATLSATDSVGKKASLPVSGSTVEASGSALSITSASMTPPTLTFQGGLITITASVSEPNSGAGVTGVNVSMFQNGASYGGFKLTSQGGGVYSGTFPAPKNVTGASQTYTASVKATDSAGLSATSAVSGSTVVPSGSALSIVSASMSPPTLSFSGGAITITANVNEPNASASITGVNVSMFQNGASFGGFKLSAQGGGVYSGVFGASKNLSGTALIYTATLKVTDSAGLNASAAVSGSTTEPSGSPLTITSASMSPANLTVSGGLMTFTVSVNEPNAGVTVSAVNISLFQNGGSYGGFKLSSAGGGVYTGSFPAPKNTSGVLIVYTATVKATDSAGLSATGAVAGSSTVAGS